jgi:hypothetical protein
MTGPQPHPEVITLPPLALPESPVLALPPFPPLPELGRLWLLPPGVGAAMVVPTAARITRVAKKERIFAKRKKSRLSSKAGCGDLGETGVEGRAC